MQLEYNVSYASTLDPEILSRQDRFNINGNCILVISDMLIYFKLSFSGVRIMARKPRRRVNHLLSI